MFTQKTAPVSHLSNHGESFLLSPLRKETLHILCVVISLYWSVFDFKEFANFYRPDEPMLPVMCLFSGLAVYIALRFVVTLRKKEMIFGFVVLFIYSYVRSCITKGTYSSWMVKSTMEELSSQLTCVIVSIPRNSARLSGVKARLAEVGLKNCEVYMGEDSSKFKSPKEMSPEIADLTPAQQHFMGYIANTVMMRDVFAKYSTAKTKWVAVFEDDARPLEGFERGLPLVAEYYRDSDMIWLDNRNALSWTFMGGSLVGGTTGTLFATSSLQKMASLLMFDHPNFQAFRVKVPSRVGIQIDAYLASTCNSGIFKCSFVPLTAEVCGVQSSTEGHIKVKHDNQEVVQDPASVEIRKALRSEAVVTAVAASSNSAGV